MTEEFERTNREVLSMTARLLDGVRPRFEERGLSARSPEMDVLDTEPNRYTSEIRVFIEHQGDIVDALEFHVFENGRRSSSDADLEQWLVEQLEELVERYAD
jgi:hypothetical protein